MRNDSDRLQWQTEKNYIMNTFHNGLRRIQTDSKTAQQYVLLCLALAVAALIMVSGGSGEDVISVVFRPCLLYTSPSPRDGLLSRMPSSA